MKNALCVIGEALIDFIPLENGKNIKEVSGFLKAAGGAPANVAGVVAKLGGKAKLLTKLGNDSFGQFLIDSMDSAGIDTSYIKLSNTLDTSLAFVCLDKQGNRDFKFYRKSAADLDYSIDDVDLRCLEDVKILHFCSVDLVPSKMKDTHRYLIQKAKENNIIISFDPNLRLNLWEDLSLLKQTVNDFILYSDIIKISDEELEFICGSNDINHVVDQLLKTAKLIIYTKGKDGAELFTRNNHIEVKSLPVNVVDTTGAGDTFIGAFIYQLLQRNVIDLDTIDCDTYEHYMRFASIYAAYMTTVKGVLTVLPDMDAIESFAKTYGF